MLLVALKLLAILDRLLVHLRVACMRMLMIGETVASEPHGGCPLAALEGGGPFTRYGCIAACSQANPMREHIMSGTDTVGGRFNPKFWESNSFPPVCSGGP